jgi:hypothetical protein
MAIMNNHPFTFGLKFANQPHEISVGQVAAVLSAYEDLFQGLMSSAQPPLFFTLKNVEVGSYILIFQAPADSPIPNLLQTLKDILENKALSYLSEKSLDALKRLRNISRELGSPIEFWQRQGEDLLSLGRVSPTLHLDLKPIWIRGRTSLQGYLIRVGGEDPPRATLRLANGQPFTCQISRKAHPRLSKKLGERLYSQVILEGIASWHPKDFHLHHFLVEALSSYNQPDSLFQALDALQAIGGTYWEAATDFEANLALMRGQSQD